VAILPDESNAREMCMSQGSRVGAQFQKQDNEEEEKGTPEVEVI
jgi:hypothetical protein